MREYEQWAESNLDIRSKSGDEWDCLCIFHEDTNPSMRVNVEKGLYYCHACGKGGHLGGVIGVAPEATSMLSGKSILERLSLEPEEALPEHVLRKYRQSVMHPYWGERGFDNNIVEKWDLGYDPMRNAVTIPYRNHMGRLRGIIRRYLDHDVRVRYKYPKGSKISEILFGAWRSYDMPIFICEGSLDAIKLDQFGMSAVAILGSRISDYQVGELRRMGATDIILMLDNDRAGQEAEAAIYDRLKHEQFVLNLRRVDGKMFGRRKDGVKAKDPGEMKPKKLRALADRYT